MQDLAEGMSTLAGQLDRLKDIPKSHKLRRTISEFPEILEVVNFIEQWLASWSGGYSARWDKFTTESLVAAKHILIVPHKGQVIELKHKIDAFGDKLYRHLLIEILSKQGLVFLPDIHHSTWLICDWYQPRWQKMQRLPLTRNRMI